MTNLGSFILTGLGQGVPNFVLSGFSVLPSLATTDTITLEGWVYYETITLQNWTYSDNLTLANWTNPNTITLESWRYE